MADSNITKNALAASLKALMACRPLNKISVGDICEKCGMNRKSFYYHFKDKYDLVNWIFDNEFLAVINTDSAGDSPELFTAICEYFYSEQDFYRNALEVTGQNSFRDYFCAQVHPVLKKLTAGLLDGEDNEFMLTFLSDALVVTLIRWLKGSKNLLEPAEFSDKVFKTVFALAKAITIKYDEP